MYLFVGKLRKVYWMDGIYCKQKYYKCHWVAVIKKFTFFKKKNSNSGTVHKHLTGFICNCYKVELLKIIYWNILTCINTLCPLIYIKILHINEKKKRLNTWFLFSIFPLTIIYLGRYLFMQWGKFISHSEVPVTKRGKEKFFWE